MDEWMDLSEGEGEEKKERERGKENTLSERR
jgi:hypothetical protein